MNVTKSKKIHKELGEKIKNRRLEKNMKIVEVSKLTGLTSSMISQVERSLISPSIDTLKKISEAIDIPVSYFFQGREEGTKIEENKPVDPIALFTEQSPMVRMQQRKMLSPKPGVTYYLLNPDMSGPIELVYGIYQPGSGTHSKQNIHIGHECGLILDGQLTVIIGDQEYVLEKGDSITFCSESAHSKMNKSDAPCTCIWASTPPWF